MTESGTSKRPGSASKSSGHAGADQVQGEVADHLGRRGDLDHVAEHPVGRGVAVLDLLEAVAEPERDGLLAQVGQLPAGDLVGVDPAGRRGQAGLERRVHLAHGLPVGLEVATALRSSPVARSVWSVAATIADSGGWLVVPAMVATAPSTASTPASRRRAGWPAGRRRCRGCAGAPAGRTARAARVTSGGRPAAAAARPCP